MTLRLRGRKPSEKRIAAAFEELRGLVRARCLELGGIQLPERTGIHSVGVIVPTRLGALWVWGPHLSEFLTVFARFEDPARGARVGANPYTGKWNHHGGTIREGAAPREVFAAWAAELDDIRGGTCEEVDIALAAAEARSRTALEWHEAEKARGDS